jgi:hypothetical protein
MLARGEVAGAIKVGRRWVVPREALDAMLRGDQLLTNH